ncbi:Methyltransferase domain-containing protein [Filimonas lacunae]|uniref:Methyltransferase domain-containing protein n=1 Tax=Filimonas lacunae TaxID=477680 RepID=A0A173MDJ6_9BACT|nr:class I SAM-dependent methyltransferase [Filimonas lacunae]BAV05508.1 methyltransferase [Filimonas lacunae]SIT20663.1 Methyltransferase domain-containing protein [Filimonas lacunae]
MVEEITYNSISRFSNRAENYMKYRPGYPEALVPFLETRFALPESASVADIGSGTGLFGELLLKKGYAVTGVEPNVEMAEAAEAKLSKYSAFTSLRNRAEETALPAQSQDLITVAQAFHWLDPIATKEEFRRILKPGGHVVLAWNIPQVDTPFMTRYLQLKDEYKGEEKMPEKINEYAISDFFLPGGFETAIFPNTQTLDFEGLKGQLLSSSYIPLPGHPSYQQMINSLIQLFIACNESGFVHMKFNTVLYWNSGTDF